MSDPKSSSGAPHPSEPGESSPHPPSGYANTSFRAGEQSVPSAPEASTAAKMISGSKAVGRGVAATARVTGRAGRKALAFGQKAAGAQGADKTGLNRLLELNVLNSAGNTAVTISLAGSIFFSGATSEARGQVAAFLAMTLLPFAIVAPLIGPFLDRFSHGRRWAMGGTMAIRAFLCWLLADALVTGSNSLYPLALGVLVTQKAYGVTGNAAIPRLLPPDLTLVKANGRCSLAGLVGAGLSAPLAGGAALIGPEWALRYAFAVYAFGTIRAMMLPAGVDSTKNEEDVDLDGRNAKGKFILPGPVAFALRVNCGPRFLSGFLTMYMAFYLRDADFSGWRPEMLMGLVIGAAGVGNFLGITLASLLKKLNPSITVVAALLADAIVCGLAALIGGVWLLAALGLAAGLAQSLAKLSLDATIQQYVPERVRTSAFARSDTLLQIAWVFGGFAGIIMPLNSPTLSLGAVCAALGGWFFVMVVKRPAPAPRVDSDEPSTAVAVREQAAPPVPTNRDTLHEPTVPLVMDWDQHPRREP